MADDTNAFNNPASVAAPAKAASRPKSSPVVAATKAGDRGSGASGSRVGSPPKANPNTAVSGVAQQIGRGQRQLDGSRTAEWSKGVKKGGLAERQAVPDRHPNSRDSRSGLEGAMGALADQLHVRSRPKVTQKRK